MKSGDLLIIPHNPMNNWGGYPGYKTFPGEYDYHTIVWVTGPIPAIYLQQRERHAQILVDGRRLWFDINLVKGWCADK